jgi:hypothetical protein
MNINSSSLKVGTTISFHPVAYAPHVAEGTILRRFTDRGWLCLEVKAFNCAGAGKVWTIFPEDVICVRPAKPACVLDLRDPAVMEKFCNRHA